MKNNVVKIAALVALMALVGSAFAQGGGNRGQRMGGRGGMMQMGNNPMFLLRDKNVQDDLALTSEQKSKLEGIQRKVMEEMSAMRENMVGGDRESMMAAMQKVNESATKEVNALLSPEQQKRIKEIALHVAGNRAILQPEVQKELALTDGQKAKIKDLQEKQQQAMQSLFEKMRNQEISREDMQASMEKNNEIMGAELGKVLSSEQSAKMKTMQGRPFKGLVPRERRGGGIG